jgi:hypothetical protein
MSIEALKDKANVRIAPAGDAPIAQPLHILAKDPNLSRRWPIHGRDQV